MKQLFEYIFDILLKLQKLNKIHKFHINYKIFLKTSLLANIRKFL